jgi:hypothetical protein
MMDILKVPCPEKWEYLDYLCLLCVYITLPCLRFIYELNNMDRTGIVEDREDTVDDGLGAFVIGQVGYIFPFLQVTSIVTVMCFFDEWLVKSASSTSSAEPNEITNTPRLSARTGRDVDEDGNKWTHAQGTMSFTTERARDRKGHVIIRYNVTRYYIVLINRPGEEIWESQKWKTKEQYSCSLPAWMKRVGLDEKRPNGVARFPMRVLERDPAFAVVCSADSDYQTKVLYPRRTRVRFGLFLFLFVGAGVIQEFYISHLPLTSIDMFCINAWTVVQYIWGCSLGLACHVNRRKYHLDVSDS